MDTVHLLNQINHYAEEYVDTFSGADNIARGEKYLQDFVDFIGKYEAENKRDQAHKENRMMADYYEKGQRP